MKKFRLLIALFLSMTGIIALQASNVNSKAANDSKISGYGFNCSSVVSTVHGIYSFVLDSTMHDVTSLGLVHSVTRVSGAVLVGDRFYYLDWTRQPYSLSYCTLTDTARIELKKYSEYVTPAYMNLNHNDGKVYCIGTDFDMTTYEDITYLQNIDLTTGAITNVCSLKSSESNEAVDVKGFAISRNGDMYTVDGDGNFYSVNATDGKCTMIGTMDYMPDASFYYWNNCLFFDDNTNKLYYRMETSHAGNELVQIDPETAKVTRINTLGANLNLDGITVLYKESPMAPGKAIDFNVTPGAKGALTATLNWTNPSMTNDGSDLKEITSVEILRNDVKVGEITDATPGGKSSWTDSNVPANGMYKYAVKVINKDGESELAIKSLFIGRGIPMAATNVKLSAKDDGSVLTWKAPEIGEDSSYIDVKELKYDVVRYPDKDTVAVDLTDTTFAEESIDSLQKYYYTVTAKTKEGNSKDAMSNSAVLGKALNAPCYFPFDNKTSLNTWTILDGNNDNTTWHWAKGYYETLTGASVVDYSGDKAADEWLISPRINMSKNFSYRVSFKMQSASSNVSILDVTLGNDTLPSKQVSFDQIIVEKKTDSLSVDLPEITTDSIYRVGFHFQSNASSFDFHLNDVTIEATPKVIDAISQQENGNIALNGRILMIDNNDNVRIYNVDGMLMNIRKCTEGSYDLSGLKSGVYVVLVSNGNAQKRMKIVLK